MIDRSNKEPEGSDIASPRREQLRQRVLDAVRAAGPRIQAAGAATVGGIRAAGAAVLGGGRAGLGAASLGAQRVLGRLAAIGAKVWEKLRTATQPVWQKLCTVTGWVWATLRAATGPVWEKLRTATGWVSQKLRAPTAQIWDKLRTAIGSLFGFLARGIVAGTLAAGGAMALGAAIGRYRGAGFDSEVVVMLAVAGMLIALLLPMAVHGLIARFPRLARVALAAVAVAVLTAGTAWFTAGTAWFANLGTSMFASIGGGKEGGKEGVKEGVKEGGKEVVGRASVVAGDQLRVAGTTVRLSGIEVPEREQRCGKDNNKWRCAEAAQSALLKVISSRAVRCRLTGSDKAGRPLGHCSIDAVDINAELVRQGYVFAEGGTLARYSGQEREARNAKAGMWIGDTQRPAELRAKAWEEAKRNAPDGCPIKGQVTGQERVYVLPGTPDYQRVRVQTSRGDRWFCSEQEAASAGFKEAQRGSSKPKPTPSARPYAGA